MSDKDQGSRARVYSISDGSIVTHLFVCMEFNLFLYMMLIILVSLYWPSLGEDLDSPDSHLASCFMYGCYYV